MRQPRPQLQSTEDRRSSKHIMSEAQALAVAEQIRIELERAEARALAEVMCEAVKAAAAKEAKRTEEAAKDKAEAEAMTEAMHEAAKRGQVQRLRKKPQMPWQRRFVQLWRLRQPWLRLCLLQAVKQ